MPDKIKWSVLAALVMLVVNNEILSWMILTVLGYVWGWSILKEVVTHD